MIENSKGYDVVKTLPMFSTISYSHIADPESMRSSAHPSESRDSGYGTWFLFVLAFLFSMAWGVLAAFAAETAPLPKTEGSAGPTAAQPSTSAIRNQRRPQPPATLAAFKPIRFVYLQTEGKPWRKPAGVFVDRETGEVVVADTGNNLVTLLSAEGVPLYSLGYNGEVPQPTQAVVDKRGRFLVLAGVPRKVKVLDYQGELRGDFNFPGFQGAAQVVPTAITIDASGNTYVADSTSGRILVYDQEDRLVLSFGKRGDGPGAFSSVTGIAVDPSGTIYVADAQHKPAIQVFDPQGQYLRGWGEHNAGPQNFSLPSAVGLDSTGRVLVVDTIRQVVSVFTPEGNFLFRFGGLGAGPGALAYPAGLGIDSAGRLYVSESVNARVQVFELADAGAAPRAPARPGPSTPPRVREELRRGLGEVLKEIQK